MKKILSCLALLIILASPVFASVGINVNGTTIGTAGNLYVNCNTGGAPFIDGFNYSATCSSNLVADGTANGGYTSLGTIDSGLSLTNAVVEKAISGASGGTTTDTLPAGTPNQLFTIIIGSVTNSGTWKVTPAAGSGTGDWSSITFNTAGQVATFLYVNTTIGWMILSADGNGSGAAPTVVYQ